MKLPSVCLALSPWTAVYRKEGSLCPCPRVARALYALVPLRNRCLPGGTLQLGILSVGKLLFLTVQQYFSSPSLFLIHPADLIEDRFSSDIFVAVHLQLSAILRESTKLLLCVYKVQPCCDVHNPIQTRQASKKYNFRRWRIRECQKFRTLRQLITRVDQLLYFSGKDTPIPEKEHGVAPPMQWVRSSFGCSHSVSRH